MYFTGLLFILMLLKHKPCLACMETLLALIYLVVEEPSNQHVSSNQLWVYAIEFRKCIMKFMMLIALFKLLCSIWYTCSSSGGFYQQLKINGLLFSLFPSIFFTYFHIEGLTSWLSFVASTVSLSLSHWYSGPGVVLDCIDSWYLHLYLLCYFFYLYFMYI